MIYNVLHGPYINNEGRRIIFVRANNQQVKCISYARCLMAEHLGRELTEDEVVDHVDEDKLNDCIENYQILTRAENARKTALLQGTKWHSFVCPICFIKSKRKLRVIVHNWKQGKSGPFCSKKCARKHQCVSGGTGIHTGLKNQCPRGIEGSNPS